VRLVVLLSTQLSVIRLPPPAWISSMLAWGLGDDTPACCCGTSKSTAMTATRVKGSVIDTKVLLLLGDLQGCARREPNDHYTFRQLCRQCNQGLGEAAECSCEWAGASVPAAECGSGQHC
jgi:hypothetical protein